MCITPLLPVAHRAGERVTWLKFQWKFSDYPAHFCEEIYNIFGMTDCLCMASASVANRSSTYLNEGER